MKICSYALLILFFSFTAPIFATVNVSSPGNGSTVGSPVQFVATASADCWRGVASMGVYINNSLQYVATGSSMNTSISLGPGHYNAVVQEWDNCGGASTAQRQISVSGRTGVFVSSPGNNSTVSSTVNVVATAATNSCPSGVASMGVYADNALKSVQGGSKLNAQLGLSPGYHHLVVQEWDQCGGASTAPVDVNVAQSQAGHVIANIQAAGGWNQWGELPPADNICSPCSGVTWWMGQHVKNPSMSGNATQFVLGGTTPYADVLWSNKLLGQGSTQGMPDNNHTLLPTIHNMVYDADVYVTNSGVTQSLEFDANMYMNGVGMEWGTQCNHLGDGSWDIWDNVNAHWVSTGAACNLKSGWNHVTLQVQRQPNNDLLYQSITWNGVTVNLNRTYAPFHVPGGWWGVTVNYQMDGNHNQASNTTFVDNLNLRYW